MIGGLPLATPRLLLRHVTRADAGALHEIFSDPEVMRYWSCPPYRDPAQAEKLARDIIRGYEDESFLQLAVERRDDKRFLGTCTLFGIHRESRRAELGYVLGRPHWGHGYMHEALVAFIDFAFGPLGLHRLEADIDPRNRASVRTVERIGFKQEGLLRERWIVNGEISDSVFLGLLAPEWKASLVRSPGLGRGEP